jgi:tetraacyldisaccharide 4'-kinase
MLYALRGRAGAVRGPLRVPGLRVVSVGNLAVGGTGKTPVVRWIAGELLGSGASTCVLVGGAGSDEAELHRRWNPEAGVLVDRERTSVALRARDAGYGVAVLDDGFQHTALARDLDVVLLSADDPYPGHVLPRGPYREEASALGRAGVIVVTRRLASAEGAHALAERLGHEWPDAVTGVAHVAPGGLTRLDGTAATPPAGDVLAVCGIARPESFAEAVRQATRGDVELAAFADHHAYGTDDVERMRRRARGRAIVITEKDAVKLERWAEVLGDTLVLHDRLRWERGEGALRTRLLAAVGDAEAA